MDLLAIFFLSGGLFLGWGLGANHLGNIFGTAIGTRMLSWWSAAVLASIFVVLGAVISGAGPIQTLGKLGAVDALAGSFTTAFGAGVTVYLMTKAGLPVSTTQAIVGAIIGWSFFSGSLTDFDALTHILTGWILGPVLAAAFAAALMVLTKMYLKWSELHLLRVDAYTRFGLIIAGSFGAYSLGANNIANVMGVFVPVSPFSDIGLFDLFTLTSIQQLLLLGGVAIAVGILTYSHNVVHTVGSALFTMSPIAAWVVIMSHSLVLVIFASEQLEHFLANYGLPTFPLVPVSSSEVVIGAVIGIALLQGGRGVKWKVLARIGSGWALTPFLSGIVCFVSLFIMQNVFNQPVFHGTTHVLTKQASDRIDTIGIFTEDFSDLKNKKFSSSKSFRDALRERVRLADSHERSILTYTKVTLLQIDPSKLSDLDRAWFAHDQISTISQLSGRTYQHAWALGEELAKLNTELALLPQTKINKIANKERIRKLNFIYQLFSVSEK